LGPRGLLRSGDRKACAETLEPGNASADEPRAALVAVAEAVGASVIDTAAAAVVGRGPRRKDGTPTVELSTATATYGRVRLALGGEHQFANLATAVVTAETYQAGRGEELPAAAVRAACATVHWPGRMQWVPGDPPVLLDCAHNPEGVAALAAELRAEGRHGRVALVIGLSWDKDADGVAAALRGLGRQCWCVALAGQRCRPPGDVAAAMGRAGWAPSVADTATALSEARAVAAADGLLVLVTGSIFLVGECMQLLGIDPG
jgi:dihydrofolate synthase/folylpolyglutamate synthase